MPESIDSEILCGAKRCRIEHAENFWDQLPDEQCLQIFEYLDVFQRFGSELVCQRWRKLMPYRKLHVVFQITHLGHKYAAIERFCGALSQKAENKVVAVYALRFVQSKWKRRSQRPTSQVVFSFVSLSHIAIEHLVQFCAQDLTEIDVGGNTLRQDVLHLIVTKFPNLNVLSCGIMVAENPVFPWLFSSHATRLQKLHCQNWTPNDLPASLREFCTSVPLAFSSLAKLLEPCERLQSLRLNYHDYVRSSAPDFDLLPITENLTLFSCCVNHLSAKWVAFLTRVAPNLEIVELTMFSLDPTFDQQSVQDVETLAKLKELHLGRALSPDADIPWSFEFLKRLSPNGLKTLLFFYDQNDDTARFIGTLFSDLNHLKFSNGWHISWQSLQVLLTACANLETLDITSASRMDLETYTAFYSAPTNLQCVHFGHLFPDLTYYEAFLSKLRAQQLPKRDRILKLVHGLSMYETTPLDVQRCIVELKEFGFEIIDEFGDN